MSGMRMLPMIGLALLLALAPAQAKRKKPVWPGPYQAEVLTVIDSDTIRVVASVWPNVQVPALIRLAGVDTPEKFRPHCAAEKARALAATEFVRSLLAPGDTVWLRKVRLGKYAGRVLARVEFQQADGSRADLSTVLLKAGWARPYDGGRKADWCAILKEQQAEQEKAE